MSEDKIGKRYSEKEKKTKLQELSRKTMSTEEIEEEEAILKKAKEEREKEPSKYQLHHGASVGRNDPCPCGSGKKYKKCCGAEK